MAPHNLGRRGLIGAAALGAPAIVETTRRGGPAPRARLLGTMLNANTAGAAVSAGQTLCQVWPVPDDAAAIGVIVLNDTAAPWSLARVIAAPSDSAYGLDGGLGAAAGYLNPGIASAPANWINLTWRSGGRLNPAIAEASGPFGFTAPPNTEPDPTLGLVGSPETSTGQTNAAPGAPAARRNVPNFYYSDLAPFGGARFVMTRVLFDAAQPAARGVFSNPLWTGSVQAAGWEWTTRSAAADLVTAPPPIAAAERTNFSPIVGLVALTNRPGALIASGGDSHFDGTTTSVGFGNFAFLTATRIARLDVCPIGYMNLAMGGRSSDTFWPALNRIVRALRPSVVILQGWTANDGGASPGAEARYWDRLAATMDLTRAYGGVPVMATSFPRDPRTMANPEVRGAWIAARERALALDGPIIDATAQVGARTAGGFSGTYRTDIAVSPDTVHPGDLGHAMIADAATPVIERLIRP